MAPFLVRAQPMRDLCIAARGAEPVHLAAVIEKVETRLGNAAAASWVSGDVFTTFHDDALAIVGERRLYHLCRGSIASTANSAVMSAFVALARKMTGSRPAPFLRWLPPAWTMLLRGGGQASFVGTEDGGRVDIRGCPPAFATRGWRIGTAGAIHGVIDLVDRAGEVTLADAQAPDTATFDLRWWSAREVTEPSRTATCR